MIEFENGYVSSVAPRTTAYFVGTQQTDTVAPIYAHPASLLLLLYYFQNPKTCPSARLFPTLNIRQVAFPARKKSQYSETPSVSQPRIRKLNQMKKGSQEAQINLKKLFLP
jgi:hypothetical protein